MKYPEESLFVYGTLRRGGSNHFRMAGARFVAAGTVRGRIYQIDWFPGLVLNAAAGDVRGELFAANADLIARLDAFEGGDYRRVRAMATMEGGESIDVWLWEWLGNVDETRRIASGDWLDVEPARSAG